MSLLKASSLGRGSRNPWLVPARGGPGESPRSLLRGGKAPANSPWPGGSVPGSRRPGDWLPLAAAVQLWSTALNRIPSDALPDTKSSPPPPPPTPTNWAL
ncbi:unnamed protein product [Rangifer tarandus platyrhynchus]|uniref:Uncharacterized protein n=2 Tax=Rangifer tarandus platyrhynchus TaxID=3082113 RepID=A0ABN8Y967_RANTA|nr:unnamed protein product [Rangifer tarandus platyrhynchus]CAI9695741.1 unnamed protein product [Rangifer tarandus platyrhynchus]